MQEEKISTGAIESELDPRTVKHEDVALGGVPLTEGGTVYHPEDILHQHAVGICTAISLIQNRNKANGKKYSADFQYLLQKKFIDKAWFEGSSIFAALKIGKNIGFLPEELWTHTDENDRYLPYASYAAKLKAIPDAEVQRLISLCVDKIPGYALVDVKDPQAIAKAINESEAGILCRYGCQSNWWTPSWLPKDINPLRWAPETSGHAIIMSIFNYSVSLMQKLANTWGKFWCLEGCADINWSTYPPTEAWAILRITPTIPKYVFSKVLRVGSTGFEVKMLQRKLGIKDDGIFGLKTRAAVAKFQEKHGLEADGVVGRLTNAELNKP